MKTMKFELDQAVAIKISGERGHVRGRAEYSETVSNTPSYWVKYLSGDGRATHGWFDEADLDPVV